MIYCNSNIHYLIEEPEIFEANCLAVKFDNNTIALAIYRPPRYKNVNIFIESLHKLLSKYSCLQNIWVLGDINIDICENNSDPNASTYLNMLAYHGILPANILPTHGKTCLDHVLIKTKLLASSLVLQTSLTDHYTVALYVASKPRYKPPNTNTTRRVDYARFSEDLSAVDFSHIYGLDDVDAATNYFIKTLETLVIRNSKEIKTSNRKKILKPWVTPGVLRCLKNRDKLHKKLKTDPDNVTLQITYKRYRLFCCNILKKLKREFETSQLQNANNNNKKLWKVIKEITHTEKPKVTPTELIDPKDPLKSINNVNNYFAEIGKSLAEKLRPTNDHSPSITLKSCPNSFVLLPVDEHEIDKLISNLKSDCAVGLDMISANLVKDNKNHLVKPITYICNLAFSTGVFPTVFKKSKIVPIHKSGTRDCVGNYRPISILPTLSKILERAINKRFVKYLEDNNLLSSSQFGFRAKKSTSEAVQDLVNFVVTNLDKKEKVIVIFLDLAKAFDTVSIPILLTKLESLGIRDIQLKLFESYLTGRTQCVQIANQSSEEAKVQYGVPQGSILGPSLFLAYINDLCQLDLDMAKIITFADDTALLFKGNTWKEAFYNAQRGFNVVTNWLKDNILTLNVGKTKFITFSLRNIETDVANHNIISHNCAVYDNTNCLCPKLERTNVIKYLGVLIDSKLSFQQHVELVSARTRKLIYIFKNLRQVAKKELIRSVYLALGQSQISYCISVWGGTTKTLMLKAERAQRAILKVSLFLPFFHPTIDVYRKSGVLTVRQLFILDTISKQHSTLNYDPKLAENRRRKDIVCNKTTFKTSFAQRFFCYQGCNLYNKANRILSIYALPKTKCKAVVRDWLQNLSYDATEKLLH